MTNWCANAVLIAKANAQHQQQQFWNKECQNAMLWYSWHLNDFRTVQLGFIRYIYVRYKCIKIGHKRRWEEFHSSNDTLKYRITVHGVHTILSIFPHCLSITNLFDLLCNWAQNLSNFWNYSKRIQYTKYTICCHVNESFFPGLCHHHHLILFNFTIQ